MKIGRQAYAEMFGPTLGDRVRLADTELWIEVEKDFTLYGEEVKFGGGKVIRDGMGQSQATNKQGAADTVITNALIIDQDLIEQGPRSSGVFDVLLRIDHGKGGAHRKPKASITALQGIG